MPSSKALNRTSPILFALYTGARKANVLSCRHEQVDMARGKITFRVKSKLPGGKYHEIDIADGLAELLVTRLGHEPGKKGYIFRDHKGKHRYVKDNKKAWKSAKDAAGIDNFRWHDLRHTCASWLRQRGVPLEIIQQILGHANISTTAKYIHHKEDAKANALNLGITSQLRHIQEKHTEENMDKSLTNNGASEGSRTPDLKSHNLKGNLKSIISNKKLRGGKA